ncbi:kinesin-like protein KIN-UC isoform X2 [Malania oleifera]|uniref:kinesin-like protein KIN-UC isoform X2 n=1 Tax=Malania oleifera TaxID=397392 RepID=UPI0025AEA61B|nr:kinesin-like protein KIN-UC isoform X2 [Malania oleifera]
MASSSTLRSSHRYSERQASSSSSSSSYSSSCSSRSVSFSGLQHPPARPKLPASRRSVPTNPRFQPDDCNSEPGRVRVAVRLRPRNAEDLLLDADFADCVELQPELKRLKLRKNSWSTESYKFDELFTESASQKRVYDAVAKPVVECVLNGYNGTVMAYGQTGTGKTYTVGSLGKDDASERGIMVRALEDIISSTSPAYDSVEISYLQLYMESLQDLLAPEKINIPIVEDSKNGEISLPGAAVVKVQDLDHSLQLLQVGEANRHAENTKLNTNSSRSHAILMVNVRRSFSERVDNEIVSQEKHIKRELYGGNGIHTVRKSKLLIVDLAGSERLDKSGSEGHLLEEAKFINLSLTSLGKCINALAENNAHIPTRDSKLTRLLRDSFGGSARTSLIITIGPSARHHAETTSTIMFGQRAMKIENMLKLKEEFDYESLCRKLENQLDQLTVEIERQQKLRETDKSDMEKKIRECQNSLAEAEKSLLRRSEHHQLENSKYQKVLMDTTQMYEKKVAELIKQLEDERARSMSAEEQLNVMKNLLSNHQDSTQQKHQMEISAYQKALADTTQMYEKKIAELLKKQLEDVHAHSIGVEEKLNVSQKQEEINELTVKLRDKCQLYEDLLSEKETLKEEIHGVRQELLVEEKQRKTVENELVRIKKLLPQNDDEGEEKKLYLKENIGRESLALTRMILHKPNQAVETVSSQRATITQMCKEVGLQKILALLSSEDIDVQINAVKMVANLASEDINQEKIVEEGGLDALLRLLQSSQNATILRVASGAIANLAMNELNQGLIMNKGGARLLTNAASKTDDLQTLRMVAGAIANLCGNEKLHITLKEDGCIKALLGMVRSGNINIIAQVARGMANFAKCESRGIIQGHRKGRSLLFEEGLLEWLIANSNTTTSSTRRHIELALCHLAQNEDNAKDFISCGGVQGLARISVESTREDIRNLANKTLKLNSKFLAEMDGKQARR